MYYINMTIFIPKRGTTLYNMYASTKLTDKVYIENQGTFIITEVIAVIFYKYPHYRRAYVIKKHETKYCNKNDGETYPVTRGTSLPGINESVDIICMATARRFDLLKNMVHNLEKEYGKEIYLIPDLFWLRCTSLLYNTKGIRPTVNSYNIKTLITPYMDGKKINRKYMIYEKENTENEA